MNNSYDNENLFRFNQLFWNNQFFVFCFGLNCLLRMRERGMT